jgi:large subunit ribosomal protein L29
MKYSDMVLLSNEELSDTLKSEKELLSKLKFAHTIAPIENPLKIKSSRRTIAQLNTELTKRSKIS